jgi:hypothetical protein
VVAVDIGSSVPRAVAYPKFQQYGLGFRCIFNPVIRMGSVVQINSTLYPPSSATSSSPAQPQQAAGPNGYWYVQSLNLDLAAQEVNGAWFCECSCARVAGTPLRQRATWPVPPHVSALQAAP